MLLRNNLPTALLDASSGRNAEVPNRVRKTNLLPFDAPVHFARQCGCGMESRPFVNDSEKTIMHRGMVRESAKGNIVWRNNTGRFELPDGRFIPAGLCKGSSDVIGIEPVIINREDVGKLFGRFLAIEYKTKTGRLTPEQQHFLDVVRACGGTAIVDRGEENLEG